MYRHRARLMAIILGVGGLPAATAIGAEAVALHAFTTRFGTFTPQPWSAVAGWSQTSHAEALDVFRSTCRSSLQRRETWRRSCASAQAAGAGEDAARAFFEGEFVPHLVSARDKDKEGLMTGYFEPVLEGSAVRKSPFVVPVYGPPSDLLYLDARRWKGVSRNGAVRAGIVKDQVLPVTASAPTASGPTASGQSPAQTLQVVPSVFESEPLDRRYRVRREGDRIVPYWTRQQIEAGAPIGSKVIAWVDDPQALYLMQVQGSGQIRMPGGETVRLSYADQNGHPFKPRGDRQAGVRTRGLPGGTESDAVATPVSMRSLQVVGAGARKGQDAPSQGRVSPSKDEVQRVVDALLAQPPQSKADRMPSPVAAASDRAADARTTMSLSYLVAARANDPSYVFFEPATSEGGGPIGALGVPLTATRSIAVDPRSTPLGSPVFIEAERDDSAEPLRRLMIAQDTGGAIRGAVRADFFWGTGPEAGSQAVRTRDDLAMWVLLPKGFEGPRAPATRTRSIEGTPATPAECVMPDAEYCLE